MLGKLPNPKYQSIIVCDTQTVDDIAGLITYGVQQSIPQAKTINNFFIGRNTDETCRRIWTYLKHNVKYKAEPPNLQTVKTLSRLLKTDRVGDCKHLATASAALCLSLGIPVKLRMVGFSHYDKHPKHIYTVAVKNGREYVIDAVMNKYDTEPAYKFKRDIKLNP